MSSKLRALLARLILIAGVLGVGLLMAPHMPREQSIAVRLGNRQVRQVSGVVTRLGDAEPTAGFSQDFSGASPRTVRHEFSAPDGTYIVVITFRERGAGAVGEPAPTTNQDRKASPTGELNPNQPETSFERRVSLVGGEVTVSPD